MSVLLIFLYRIQKRYIDRKRYLYSFTMKTTDSDQQPWRESSRFQCVQYYNWDLKLLTKEIHVLCPLVKCLFLGDYHWPYQHNSFHINIKHKVYKLGFDVWCKLAMLPSQLSVYWLWLWAVCPQLHLDSVTAGSFDHVRPVKSRPCWHRAVRVSLVANWNDVV